MSNAFDNLDDKFGIFDASKYGSGSQGSSDDSKFIEDLLREMNHSTNSTEMVFDKRSKEFKPIGEVHDPDDIIRLTPEDLKHG